MSLALVVHPKNILQMNMTMMSSRYSSISHKSRDQERRLPATYKRDQTRNMIALMIDLSISHFLIKLVPKRSICFLAMDTMLFNGKITGPNGQHHSIGPSVTPLTAL